MDGNSGEEDSNQDESISFEHDAGELEDLEQLSTVSCYFECIFGLKEMYIYRAVINAYLRKYQEAIDDFGKLVGPTSSEQFSQTSGSL